MTLYEAEKIFIENNLLFEKCEFENEATYWHHITLFPYVKNARNCKVIALIITSNNGKKNIELQFNAVGADFIFEELHFGDFCFDMARYNEEMLVNDLLNRINEIKSGTFSVIVANDLKNKRWLGDSCFDINDDDDDDFWGKSRFEKAIETIQAPKGFISKLLKTKKQYEIYDWNTYQCIIK